MELHPHGGMVPIWTISVLFEELMALPISDEYLFFNYGWKHDFANEERVTISFDNWKEAAGVHHELWKLRIPSLKKNWS